MRYGGRGKVGAGCGKEGITGADTGWAQCCFATASSLTRCKHLRELLTTGYEPVALRLRFEYMDHMTNKNSWYKTNYFYWWAI